MPKFGVSAVQESGYNIVFVFISFFLGYALKCNSCGNSVGWEECTKNKTVTCQFPEDHCGTGYLKAIFSVSKATAELFVKNCANSSDCNKTKVCNTARELLFDQKIIKCEVRCFPRRPVQQISGKSEWSPCTVDKNYPR